MALGHDFYYVDQALCVVDTKVKPFLLRAATKV